MQSIANIVACKNESQSTNIIINSLKFYPRFLFQDKLKSYEMAISHFPGFNKKEVEKKVSVLNEINSTDMNLNFISKDLFFLSSKS